MVMLTGAHLDVRALADGVRLVLLAQQFQLVGLPGHGLTGLVLGHDATGEGLVRVDDLLHQLLDGLEVLRSERLLDVEVEVETVRDVRADAQLGARPQLLHGLGHDVGGGVAQDVQAVLLGMISTPTTSAPAGTCRPRSCSSPSTRITTVVLWSANSSVPVVPEVTSRCSELTVMVICSLCGASDTGHSSLVGLHSWWHTVATASHGPF